MASRIVDRDCDTRKVDKGLKNPWKWKLLERKVGDQLICRFIRKLSSRGLAFCELCSKEVNYASRGWKAFGQHLLKKLHIENKKNPGQPIKAFQVCGNLIFQYSISKKYVLL